MKEKYEEKVKLQHMDEETLDNILSFIYNCQVSISSENVYKILQAANFMDIRNLKAYCMCFLCEEVDKHNCFSILKYAKMYNMKALVQKIDLILKEEFEFIVKGKEFKDLEFEEILKIIQIKEKKITSQENVYHALIDWIKHDVKTRDKFIVDLFKLIELEQLSGDFLSRVVSAEDLVLNSNDCMKIVFKSTASRLKNAQEPASGEAPSQEVATEVFYPKVGMEDGRILDSQITASSSYSRLYEPKHGRLNKEAARGDAGCWMPRSREAGEYIQIAFKAPMRISGVITQGRPDAYAFTTSYTIAYGNSTNNMQMIKDSSGNEKIFEANTDNNSEVINMFPQPLTTSFIRLIIQTWNGFPAIRMELLTC